MRVVLQVGEVVARAYDTLTKLVKGENFMRKIGIQHLVRWLDGKSYGSGAAHNKHDTPNPYTMTTLPLKSPLQRKQQQARRRARERAAEKAESIAAARRAKVDWVSKASVGISAAAAAMAEREIRRQVEEVAARGGEAVAAAATAASAAAAATWAAGEGELLPSLTATSAVFTSSCSVARPQSPLSLYTVAGPIPWTVQAFQHAAHARVRSGMLLPGLGSPRGGGGGRRGSPRERGGSSSPRRETSDRPMSRGGGTPRENGARPTSSTAGWLASSSIESSSVWQSGTKTREGGAGARRGALSARAHVRRETEKGFQRGKRDAWLLELRATRHELDMSIAQSREMV